MKTISKQYLNFLNRPTCAIVHFNDVFTNNNIDFDAELTAIIRNLGNFSDLTFPIGKNEKLADYGINLLDDLIEEQKRILGIIKKNGKIVKNNFSEKTVIAIINKAPRDSRTTFCGKNGEDFHLAITKNGLEVYTVPLARLQALETRNKIVALYRIPNEKLKVTDGFREQFRSSIIATSRYFPEILNTIFEYSNQAELIKAKLLGQHPCIIPEQKRLAEFAFADKFGNVRISVKNNKQFRKTFAKARYGDSLKIKIGKCKLVEAIYTSSLKEIPDGKLGIYQNIPDGKTDGASYWEIVKKSEDCNNEKESALTILEEINPNLSNEEISID